MIHQSVKQFEFEHWSNTLLLNALRSIAQPDERAVLLFSHILSSHCMWLCRVNKTELTCSLFQERSLDECEQLMIQNLNGWKAYLTNKTEQELEASIEFMSAWETPPRKRTMTVGDAIIHLINHSSYHRGQIIARIKSQIDILPLTTYIMYASELL